MIWSLAGTPSTDHDMFRMTTLRLVVIAITMTSTQQGTHRTTHGISHMNIRLPVAAWKT